MSNKSKETIDDLISQWEKLLKDIETVSESLEFDENDNLCIKVTNELIETMNLATGVPIDGNILVTEAIFINRINEVVDEIIDRDIRIMYHLITKEHHSNFEEDKDGIIKNTDLVYSEAIKIDAKDKSSLSYKKRKVFLKIYDHYQLVLTQNKDLLDVKDNLEKVIEESGSKLMETETRLKELENSTSEELKTIKKSTLESIEDESQKTKYDQISILGIFTGISFITFGGMNSIISLNSLWTEDNALGGTLLCILGIGFILINAISILMQYIKSLSIKDVRVIDMVWNEDIKFKIGPLVYFNLFILVFSVLIWFALIR